MHWQEQVDKLRKHKEKHEKGATIPANWRLGGCEICFPQSVGLGIEAGQFWEFLKEIVPEAKLITSRGQERVIELVHLVRDLPKKPNGTDLTKVYTNNKAGSLVVEYERNPSVGLEPLARGIRRVALETKDFRIERNPKEIFLQFLEEEARKSPIGFIRSAVSGVFNKGSTPAQSIAEEPRDHVSITSLTPETLSGESTPEESEETQTGILIEGVGEDIIRTATALDTETLRKALEEINFEDRVTDKGKQKEDTPPRVPTPEPQQTATDLTPNKTGPSVSSLLEIVRLNITPYVQTGLLTDEAREKFEKQIQDILAKDKSGLTELRKVLEEKVQEDYESYYVKVGSDGNLGGPFGDSTVTSRKVRAQRVIAEVRKAAIENGTINYGSLNNYLRFLSLRDIPLFRQTYQEIVTPQKTDQYQTEWVTEAGVIVEAKRNKVD